MCDVKLMEQGGNPVVHNYPDFIQASSVSVNCSDQFCLASTNYQVFTPLGGRSESVTMYDLCTGEVARNFTSIHSACIFIYCSNQWKKSKIWSVASNFRFFPLIWTIYKDSILLFQWFEQSLTFVHLSMCSNLLINLLIYLQPRPLIETSKCGTSVLVPKYVPMFCNIVVACVL